MTDTTTDRSFPEDIVIADTVRWLEKAVIGLNLCPFAKSVHVKGQIHYVVSQATDAEGVAMDLHRELEALAEISPEKRDTTLLILPQALRNIMPQIGNNFIINVKDTSTISWKSQMPWWKSWIWGASCRSLPSTRCSSLKAQMWTM